MNSRTYAAALAMNIILINVCIKRTDCEFCAFNESNTCRIGRWGIKEYFDNFNSMNILINKFIRCNDYDSCDVCQCNLYGSCATNVWILKYNQKRGRYI